MIELIDFIKCRFIIIINILPLYKIFFAVYLLTPVVILTIYRFKNLQIKSSTLAVVLFLTWLFQIMVWNIGHDIFYKIS